ncbi:MAG: RibD family protein, partial [Chloroflexi bacterium]|nr:RibD family protein [Chloroflexota bacterium]
AGDAEGPRPMLRVVVDSRGRLPRSAALLKQPGRVLHVVAAAATAGAMGRVLPAGATGAGTSGVGTTGSLDIAGVSGTLEVETITLPAANGSVDLKGLIDELGRRGCAGVLVEGGARLLGGFFDARLVDKVVAFVSPKIFGGIAAPGAVAGIGVETPGQAAMLERVRVEQLGEDFMISGYVVKSPGTSKSGKS